MNESIDPLIFLTIKSVVFVGYIYFGFRYFRGDAPGFIVYSLALGLARGAFGLLLGAVAFFLATLVAEKTGFIPPADVVGKFILTSGCLLPGRVLLWTIVGRLVAGRLDRQVFIWVVGGVAISLPFDLYICLKYDKFVGPFLFVG